MLSASDPTAGVASTSYRLDGGPLTPYLGPFQVLTFGPHTLDYRSTDAAGNVEATKTVSWGSDFTAADQLAGLSRLVTSFGLEKGLSTGLLNNLDEAGKKLDKQKDACAKLDAFLRNVLDEAGRDRPRLSFARAEQLLSANQIEALVGCIPRGSTRPNAEHDLLMLMQTIDGLAVDKTVANDLGNDARHVAQQVALRDDRNACRAASDYRDKIQEIRAKGKVTAAQAATLDDAVAQISREIGC